MQVRETNRLAQPFLIRIVRISTRAESAAADIDRIRPGIDCRSQAVERTRREREALSDVS